MALKLIQDGIVRGAPLISNTYSLDDIIAAFEQTASRSGLESMVRIA